MKKTSAICFPFDLFGSGGAGNGARLLLDALQEMLADNKRERLPTRARAYTGQVRTRELPFETLADIQNWRQRGRDAVRAAWKRGDFLLWLTGNHLGSLPVYDELAGAESGNVLIVQFDAHLDVYNLSDCTSELSHGNFLLHCDGKLPPLINLGHRELLLTKEYVAQYYARTFAASELAVDSALPRKYLRNAVDQADRVFLDLDCDVLDPAYFPGVSHALPFGITPQTLLSLLDAAWTEKIIGISISEFDPGRDRDERSLAMLVWLMEYVLLMSYE